MISRYFKDAICYCYPRTDFPIFFPNSTVNGIGNWGRFVGEANSQ
jgi:hypothetical protein